MAEEKSKEVQAYRLQGGEGGPRLESVLRGEARAREIPPIPTVVSVAVEVDIAVEWIIGVCCHPPLLLRLGTIGRTRDQEGATRVLLYGASMESKYWLSAQLTSSCSPFAPGLGCCPRTA